MTPPRLPAARRPSPALPRPIDPGRGTPTPQAPPLAPSHAPPHGRRHWSGLDGLRALAVLAVIGYHAGIAWVPGGFLGVDLFFVVSGFLITSLLIAELDATGRISLGRFYLRRARRLLPALLLMLALVTCLALLFWPQELPKVRGDLAASLTYLGNWWMIVKHQSYFQASGRPSAFQHLWSLAVEEQFYLVWPLALCLVLAGRTTIRKLTQLAMIGLGGALASAIAMAVLAIRADVPFGADASRVYLGTDTHAMGVLAGAGAAALMAALERTAFGRELEIKAWSVLADLLGAASLLGIGYALVHWSEFTPGLYRGGFLAFALVAALAVVSVSRPNSLLGAALDARPVRWLGTRSYALYLWHWPIFVLTRPQIDIPLPAPMVLAIRLVLTVGAAEASYRWVERPLRANGIRHYLDKATRLASISPRWRPAIAAYGAGLLVALGVAAFLVVGRPGPSRAVFFNQPVTAAARPAAAHLTVARARVAALPAPSPAPHVSPAPQRAVAVPDPPGPEQGPMLPAANQGPALALPPGPAAVSPPAPPVVALGDSVMLGAVADLRQDIAGISVEAVEGQQASDAFRRLGALLSAGQVGPAVVLQSGTNGSMDPVALDGLLTRLAGRRVVILNVHVPRPWQNADNATLAAAARTHANVILIDWNAAAAAHPEWFWGDGTHLRPGGAARYTALIQGALGAQKAP